MAWPSEAVTRLAESVTCASISSRTLWEPNEGYLLVGAAACCAVGRLKVRIWRDGIGDFAEVAEAALRDFVVLLVLEDFLPAGAGSVSVRSLRSWPCLARPPSGVSKIRFSSWTRPVEEPTSLAPRRFRMRWKALR